MANQKKDVQANEMYELYLHGNSLALVGEAYGVSRQAVFELLNNRGYKLRAKIKKKPFIVFNGNKYTLRNTGYFAKTTGERTLLHRDMWEFNHGKIQENYDIHHIDGNKKHNEISNFELIKKDDHARIHKHGQNQHTKRKSSAK